MVWHKLIVTLVDYPININFKGFKYCEWKSHQKILWNEKKTRDERNIEYGHFLVYINSWVWPIILKRGVWRVIKMRGWPWQIKVMEKVKELGTPSPPPLTRRQRIQASEGEEEEMRGEGCLELRAPLLASYGVCISVSRSCVFGASWSNHLHHHAHD